MYAVKGGRQRLLNIRTVIDDRKGLCEMRLEPKKLIIGALVIVFLISLILSIFILRPSKSRIVEVVQDNKVIYKLNLDTEENREIIVKYGDSSNTILIEEGEIRVSHAECPDKTCVNMGRLYSDSLPIVCLPNHLIIRFAED